MSETLQIGQPLPSLEAQTADGRRTTVQAHFGPNQTLLYFLHGTWCPECVGQYHLLQRYHKRIKETGAKLIVVTGEETETLTAFLKSAQPKLEYTVLTNPQRSSYHTIGAGSDTLSIIVDNEAVIRWIARWTNIMANPDTKRFFRLCMMIWRIRSQMTKTLLNSTPAIFAGKRRLLQGIFIVFTTSF